MNPTDYEWQNTRNLLRFQVKSGLRPNTAIENSMWLLKMYLNTKNGVYNNYGNPSLEMYL